jgi:NADPH-ferrihemoprotein reductase
MFWSLDLKGMTRLERKLLSSLLSLSNHFLRLSLAQNSQNSIPGKAAESVHVDRIKYPGGLVTIYFGSQTGTAETYAKQLAGEGADHGFLVHVVDLEDTTVLEFVQEKSRDDMISKAVFLCSTYGEGEPTDNALSNVTAMKSLLGVDVGKEEEKKEFENATTQPILSNLQFCVFGLGNTQYEHYNATGKFFDVALEKLGATRIAPIGLGDDDKDIEEDFEKWKDSVLWPTMEKLYMQDGAVVTRKDVTSLPETPFVVEFVEAKEPDSLSHSEIHSSSRHYFTSIDCPVTVVRELRDSSDPGSTVHIEIDVSEEKNFSYHTADNLGVFPINSTATIESVAKSLKYNLDSVFRVKPAKDHEWQGAMFPMPLTVRECLSRYCDLTSSLRRSDLKLLASYAKDPIDKKALLRMSSKEGKAEFREKITEQHVGLVDLLRLCPSIEAPLEHFLSFCPKMLPRYYTISSSSSLHPNTVHLTVSVTQALRSDGSVFKGLCSSYLADLTPGFSKVRIFNRESTFRLPEDCSKPIIMIGPGTGVAPMRALLQERAYIRDVKKLNIGANILYFGCKKSSQDFLYKEELKKFQIDGVLNHLFLAFSRESAKKVYVQHLLLENAKETWELIDGQGAHIYVCGGVKMGNEVAETLRSIVITVGNHDSTSAKHYLENLANKGRFVQELWA